MQRVIKKKIKLPSGMDNEQMADLFNQMLGTNGINIPIAYPRYEKIKELIEKLLKVLEMFSEARFIKDFAAPEDILSIKTFYTEAREFMEKLPNVDLFPYIANLDLVPEDMRVKFSEVYNGLKKSDLVNAFILVCDRLITYKKFLTDKDSLDGKFIINMPGADYKPFPFSGINIKFLYTLESANENTQLFIVNVLSKMLELSHKLYKEIVTPDIDIDQFVTLMMDNLERIQSIPELSRCRKAFGKIRDSVSLLRDNFDDYYRDFISTKNSTIIMEHFIVDVSKNTKSDAMTLSQFRTIIGYYRKMAANRGHDPKLDAMLNGLDQTFKELGRGTENLFNKED